MNTTFARLMNLMSSADSVLCYGMTLKPLRRFVAFAALAFNLLRAPRLLNQALTHDCIESKAKTAGTKLAGTKLGILNKVKRYLTPEQYLTLYQAQVRSCMEYCSHLWDCSAKYELDALDAMDRRARRLISRNDLLVSGLKL
ncbi:jg23681 [Pararge aegeria aegeria]|uniref:Jg23681 protein n=1 Tax=Pararge aegeria aegeria TaxID=348720 RepID=A0A8S4RE65_9NEOP|nr:jg23681 [Pararge aegeria aegeria]